MRAFCLIAVAASVLAWSSVGAADGASTLRVVAAEGFWGSIAAQVGGDRVQVTSIVTSPATDPHDYEPTAVDARTFAGAQLVVVNGVGYDPWSRKLLDANPVHGRVVLDVGDLVGVEAGDNPHRWYSPTDLRRVVDALAGGYAKLDPKHAAYFERQKTRFETTGLGRYDRLIARIKRTYHGVAVGASESIFEPLAHALGLRLVTPASFMKAISEGAEPTVADRSTIDRQIATRRIKVWVYNSQNSTPDVTRLTDAARRRGIPVTTITETPTPASARFQDWQSRQLEALASALARATGR
jgi:zinc/manganese transport system substrate-binding protein